MTQMTKYFQYLGANLARRKKVKKLKTALNSYFVLYDPKGLERALAIIYEAGGDSISSDIFLPTARLELTILDLQGIYEPSQFFLDNKQVLPSSLKKNCWTRPRSWVTILRTFISNGFIAGNYPNHVFDVIRLLVLNPKIVYSFARSEESASLIIPTSEMLRFGLDIRKKQTSIKFSEWNTLLSKFGVTNPVVRPPNTSRESLIMSARIVLEMNPAIHAKAENWLLDFAKRNFQIWERLHGISPEIVNSLLPTHKVSNENVHNFSSTFQEVDLVFPAEFNKFTTLSQACFQKSESHMLSDITVIHGRMCFSDGAIVILESGSDPRLEIVAGNTPYSWSASANDSKMLLQHATSSLGSIEHALFVGGRCDDNWFHWIVETLPQLLILHNQTNREYPVLVRKGLPASVYESIQIMTGRSTILIDDNESILVKNLYTRSYSSAGFDSPWALDFAGRINIEEVSQLRDAAISKIHPRFMDSNSRSLVLRNSQYRKILNVSGVLNLTEKFDFHPSDPGSENFISQVAKFNKTSTTVIQGGAAVANCIFMPKGSTVILLASNYPDQHVYWSRLLHPLGINLIACPETRDTSRGITQIHANYKVDIDALKQILLNLDLSK